jgi:uncharacterized membrane protein
MTSNYIIIIVVILVIDCIWLYINKNNYNNLVKKIQGFDIQLNLIGTFLSYLCVIAGLFIFSIPMIKYEYAKQEKQEEKQKLLILLSIKYGGLMGLIIYGVINATNIAIFKNYNINIAMMDTIWGFVLYSFSAYLFMSLEIYRR